MIHPSSLRLIGAAGLGRDMWTDSTERATRARAYFTAYFINPGAGIRLLSEAQTLMPTLHNLTNTQTLQTAIDMKSPRTMTVLSR